MPELRKDYILNRYVIIATDRGKRPDQFKQEPFDKKVNKCFFCPGNENTTPTEIGRIGNPWYIRWFDNKFPAVIPEGQFDIETHNRFFTFSSGYGKHEVIVESPNHEDELSDLSENHIAELLKVYSNRIKVIEKIEGIKYVQVFKNHKKEAGTSLVHTHSQIIANNIIPVNVQDEINCSIKDGHCLYCDIISIERESYRKVLENDSFVSFTPYASRFPFEVWIFSKQHKRRLDDFNDEQILHLAEILKSILVKLKQIEAPYNLVVHYAPKNKDLHFHIEITPRLATWAGFEIGSGTIINTMPPEDAAKFYRSNKSKSI